MEHSTRIETVKNPGGRHVAITIIGDPIWHTPTPEWEQAAQDAHGRLTHELRAKGRTLCGLEGTVDGRSVEEWSKRGGVFFSEPGERHCVICRRASEPDITMPEDLPRDDDPEFYAGTLMDGLEDEPGEQGDAMSAQGFGYGFGLLEDGSYRFWLPRRLVLARWSLPRYWPPYMERLAPIRSLWWVVIRGHASEICERCGRPVPVVFQTPDDIWQLATGHARLPDGEFAPGTLCPRCVDALVEPQIPGYLRWTCAPAGEQDKHVIAKELRRIADQLERWATRDDVFPPGLPDAETMRKAAYLLDNDEA